MHLHIILIPFVSFKEGNISLEDDSVVSKIHFFDLMISFLYSFDPHQ